MSLFLLSLGACAPQPARHAEAVAAPIDADGDGWRQQLDCDDADPSVHVNAREICNDRDDDCDLLGTLEAGAAASFADADPTIVGRYDLESLGCAVSAAGDFDADGSADLLIGAPGYDGALYGEGRACLFSGAALSFPAVHEISQADICLPGDQSGFAAGWALDGGADINGDGLDDLLIGAPLASTYGRAKTYVVFGE